jgi:hypothetical protein
MLLSLDGNKGLIKQLNYKNMQPIVREGKSYLEIKQDKNGFVKCPFCLKKHQHGKVSGHRIAHCDNSVSMSAISIGGEFYKKEDGYFVNYIN